MGPESGGTERRVLVCQHDRPSSLEPLKMLPPKHLDQFPSRRTFLKSMALAPFAFQSAPLFGLPLRAAHLEALNATPGGFPEDFRYRPSYPSKSPLEDLLRRAPAGRMSS